MKSLLGLSGLALILCLTACSGAKKKSDTPAAGAAAKESSKPHSLTADEITAKYSIGELNAAANLLKVVVDEAGTKPSEDKGSDLIGCPLTGQQAGTMTMPLKYLIDQMMRSETEAYTADPKSYATEKGFETCAANCACGVLSDVVEGASESALPKAAARNHARNKQHLSVKASHQTARDSNACARKQSWFCGSDLKAYLTQEASRNAQ